MTQPMAALKHGPHLPYAAVAAACRVQGAGSGRSPFWEGAALIEDTACIQPYLCTHSLGSQDTSSFQTGAAHILRQILNLPSYLHLTL